MKAKHYAVALVALALASAALLTWGCLAEVRVHDIEPAHRSALHAVHGERLAGTMANINKTYLRAHRLPIRSKRDQDFRTLEHCAAEIADYAEGLTESANLGELSPDDLMVFKGLARQLQVNANALKEAAANKDRPQARATFAKLTSTCNSCHAAFREAINQSHRGGH